MALLTCTINAVASPATISLSSGLAWPPEQPVAIGAPTSADPLDPYPLLEPITSIELLSASDPVNSPENRVTEYLDSRTETIRALVNTLARLCDLLPFYFLDRDGESNVQIDDSDPDVLVTVAAPSYMRRDFDMGGFKVVDLEDATGVDDLVTFQQLQAVQFSSEDDVQQILQSLLVRVDGTVPMALDLDMDGNRVTNLTTPPTAPAHAQPKGHFDTQVTSIQTTVLARTGILSMTADLSFQDTPSSPRFLPVNVGYPTLDGDLTNLFFLNEQIAVVGANDIPVGALNPFFGPSSLIPANFLLCDGREVSRTIYQNLFLVIGVAYGTPSNANVFKLPDLRGRLVIGKDNMGGTSANVVTEVHADQLGGQIGAQSHGLAIGEIPGHTHTFDDAHAASGVAGALQGAAATDADNTVASTGRTTGSIGTGANHNNVQPSMAVNYIIRH